MIIAIDFDGTIVEQEYPKIGKLKKDAKTVINKLYKNGHKIIIWTCRSNGNETKDDLDQMLRFLDKQGILYHAANKNVPEAPFDCYPKIYADLYIDDRALGWRGWKWEDVYSIVNGLVCFGGWK
jgi:hypothetical protein